MLMIALMIFAAIIVYALIELKDWVDF